jgi:hypothetical protein
MLESSVFVGAGQGRVAGFDQAMPSLTLPLMTEGETKKFGGI